MDSLDLEIFAVFRIYSHQSLKIHSSLLSNAEIIVLIAIREYFCYKRTFFIFSTELDRSEVAFLFFWCFVLKIFYQDGFSIHLITQIVGDFVLFIFQNLLIPFCKIVVLSHNLWL